MTNEAFSRVKIDAQPDFGPETRARARLGNGGAQGCAACGRDRSEGVEEETLGEYDCCAVLRDRT